MAVQTITILKPKVLVAEGKDEENFFEALLKHMCLHDIQVMGIGGKTQIRGRIKALINSPGFNNVISLGIIRDADDDPVAAFQSVCEALRNAGLPVPQRTLMPIGNRPKVVVMILPKQNVPGMLEDLCLEAVQSDNAMPCVTQYFECLQAQDLNLPRNISKAKVHAFLASRSKPDLRLGEAAKKKYWPFDDNAFQQVKTFLQQI